MEFCPQKLSLFTTSFTLEPKKSLLAKSTVFQIVASGKYEIWGCLPSHLEERLSYKKDAAEFSKVFIVNGKHDIGRCILSQNKKHGIKNFARGVAPQTPFPPHATANRDITLPATRANK